MEGRNLRVNRSFLAPYFNDFRHELFPMGWKPIIPFKVDQVCYTNDTPTDMQTVGEHTRSYERA